MRSNVAFLNKDFHLTFALFPHPYRVFSFIFNALKDLWPFEKLRFNVWTDVSDRYERRFFYIEKWNPLILNKLLLHTRQYSFSFFFFFCFFHLRLTYPDISRSFSFLYMYRFRVKNVKCGRVGVLTFSVYRKRAAAKTFRKIENF